MLIDGVLRGVRDRLLALRTMPNFAALNDDSLLFIAGHARERRFRAGEALLVASEPFTRMHVLIHGRVETARRGTPHQVIEAPGAVGFLAAVAGETDGWSATALVDTLTLEIPVTAFLDILEEDFAVLRNVLRIVSGEVLGISGNLPVHPSRAPAVEVGPVPERDPTLSELVIAQRTDLKATPHTNANLDALVELSRRMRIERFPPGQILFDVGDPVTSIVRIHHGRVRCTAPSGEHVDVGPGTTLGGLYGFAARPRSFSARTETFVIGHRTEVEEALAVFEMYPGLALSILRDLTRRLITR